MGCSRSWLGTGISIKKMARLNSLYGPILITLLIFINGLYGNEHNWRYMSLIIVFRIQNLSCAHSQYGKRKDDPFNASIFSLVSSNFSHFVDWRKSKRNQWVKSETVKRRKTDNANLVKWKKDKKKNNCRQNATQKVTIDQAESL